MKVTVLVGGVGGARFLLGLRELFGPTAFPAPQDDTSGVQANEHEITAIVNVGDDVLAVDAQDHALLFGSFTGTLEMGCGPLVSQGSSDVFLARISPRGRCLWSQRFGDAHGQWSLFPDVDAAGHIVILGTFEGVLELDGQHVLGPAPQRDAFLAVFDSEGHVLWSERLANMALEPDVIPQVRFAPSGQLVVLGAFTPSVGAPPELQLVRYAAQGQRLWTRGLGDPRSLQPERLAFTAEGRLLIAGRVQGEHDLGDGRFAGSAGTGTDLFLLEWADGGELLSARRFGGSASQHVLSLGEGARGHPLLSGAFEGTLDLGSGQLVSEGGFDLFVAQLSPSVAPPPESHACLPPPPGLSAWYPLDAPDPGAPVGEAPAGRLVHQARSVAGRGRDVLETRGGYLEAPAGPALDVGPGDFSLSLWLRTSETRSLGVVLDKRAQTPPGSGRVIGYSLHLYRGRLELQLAAGEGRREMCWLAPTYVCTNYASGHFVADGAWHFVTVTVDRDATDGGTFYVDGAAVAHFQPDFQAGSLDNPAPLRLGGRSFEETGAFTGLLDDVALWKRVLSPDEVARLYRAGATGLCRPEGARPHGSDSSRKP